MCAEKSITHENLQVNKKLELKIVCKHLLENFEKVRILLVNPVDWRRFVFLACIRHNAHPCTYIASIEPVWQGIKLSNRHFNNTQVIIPWTLLSSDLVREDSRITWGDSVEKVQRTQSRYKHQRKLGKSLGKEAGVVKNTGDPPCQGQCNL